MKSRLRNIMVVGLMIWAIWHIVATLIYTTNWPTKGVLASASYSYMVPLFHQNWSLFAPNIPEYDAQLIYRAWPVDSNATWSSWCDVSVAAGGDDFSKLEVIEQNILVQLNHQLYSNYYSVDGVPQFDAMTKTGAYNKALYFAGRLHERLVGPWRSLQIAVVFRFPQGDKAIENSSADSLFFPTFNHSEIRR
jgi:Family of unknown function (DUF5819)